MGPVTGIPPRPSAGRGVGRGTGDDVWIQECGVRIRTRGDLDTGKGLLETAEAATTKDLPLTNPTTRNFECI